jgi:hypothetical protein
MPACSSARVSGSRTSTLGRRRETVLLAHNLMAHAGTFAAVTASAGAAVAGAGGRPARARGERPGDGPFTVVDLAEDLRR